MSDYICEEQRLRDLLKVNDEDLMRIMEERGLPYRYDVVDGKTILRHHVGVLQMLVRAQEIEPLKFDPQRAVPGECSQRGRVLQS
jgi:hypothetical protein